MKKFSYVKIESKYVEYDHSGYCSDADDFEEEVNMAFVIACEVETQSLKN